MYIELHWKHHSHGQCQCSGSSDSRDKSGSSDSSDKSGSFCDLTNALAKCQSLTLFNLLRGTTLSGDQVKQLIEILDATDNTISTMCGLAAVPAVSASSAASADAEQADTSGGEPQMDLGLEDIDSSSIALLVTHEAKTSRVLNNIMLGYKRMPPAW